MEIPSRHKRELRQKLQCAMLAAAVIALHSRSVAAHDLILRYDLPIPFDLYLYACAAVLVATFALFAWFMRMPGGGPAVHVPETEARKAIAGLPRWTLRLLRAVALSCFVLTVGAALFATRDPDRNISLTLFWQFFILGLTYATALVGNVYEFTNPWKTLVEWTQRSTGALSRPRFVYPRSLGYWPAVILYVALVWFELFSLPGPRALGLVLIGYSLIAFAGVWCFGKAAWFRYGEFFAVFLRVVGLSR